MEKDVVVIDINRYENLMEANSRLKIAYEWIVNRQKASSSNYVDVSELKTIIGLKEEGERE